MKPLFLLLFFLTCGVSFAQRAGSPEKGAMRNIEKHRWQKAEARLRKSLSKVTLSPSLRYTLSVFYFHPDNPAFHLDSAYRYAVGALEDYALSPSRERERLRRAGVDSVGLIALRARIDSTAFEVARKTNTEAAYLEFLSHFPSALQRDLAAELRDEVAFQDALTINTHEAFNQYLTRYPTALRAPEARAHFHRLLYFEQTKDGRLGSYEKFLEQYPETPYRDEIYRNIFEISTAEGTVESLLSFMTRYPVSGLVRKAGQIIFHLLAEDEDPAWPQGFLNDSLRNLLNLNKTYLVPFLKDELYGFMDENGVEVLAPRYKTIHPDYLCGYITDEILILDDALVARNGSAIFKDDISDMTDLGIGFLKIVTPAGVRIIHKGGFVFADSVEDARILGKAFVALKRHNTWTLHTLTGRLLDARSWQDINSFDDVLVFSSEDSKFIVSKDELGKTADGTALRLSEPLDEVKQWPEGLIWGRSGAFQGVLNQSLHGVIRFDKHKLTQTTFGAVAAVPNGYVLYNWSGRKSTVFDQVNVLGKKVAVKKRDSWFLFEPVEQKLETRPFDSLRAEGAFVVGMSNDTVYVNFGKNVVRSFFRPLKVSYVPGLDSSFLAVQETPYEKTVFDLQGNRLFSASFDGMEYAGKGIFVITRKDRKGLMNLRGENILPVEFDAIGSTRGDMISVLKNKKFGAYHIELKKLIKPQYDRNLLPYAASCVVTFKDGYYGFLGWDNKPISNFEFDEVSYWNDSLALVRKGTAWNLYNLGQREIVETNLRAFNLIKDTSEEKIAIIQQESNFGVISNRGQILIPLTFSAIINVGSTEAPLYFTEKHVPEASLYIVIYYDSSGEMLRKEIYDDSADYDRIYCSDQ